MDDRSCPRIQTGRSGDVAFAVVVLAAYVTAFANGPRFSSWPLIAVLIAVGVAYLALGIYASHYCERAGSPGLIVAYFAVQIGLSTAVLYVSRGSAWLMALPLAAQGVILLPRRWMWAVPGSLVAALVLSIAAFAGWQWLALGQSAIAYLAGILFVVVFTQVAVNEEKARAEGERLAAELSEANRKLREYASQAEELATARERNRLAREIHDSLGHYLTVINVQIGAARAVLESDRPRAEGALGKAQALTQEGLAEVRRSVAALRTSPVESRPLPEAIAGLVEEFRASGIAAELVVAGAPRALPPQVDLTLYRAAQEGLTNVHRHAQASRADVALDYRLLGRVRLVVRDDGVGSEGSEGGFGLVGVRERAELLGGQVSVRTAPGEGFALEVELPA